MLRIITLNLNGIRSACNKGFLSWLEQQNADIVCLQEIKAQTADLNAALHNPPGFRTYYHCAEKKGYSGVALWCRHEPKRLTTGLGHPEFDAEGRFIRADFEHFSVASLYLPSGSSSPERQAVKFRFMAHLASHMAAMATENRPIVIAGDWNIAHQTIDLKNWRSNQKNSGFLPEERAWIGAQLAHHQWQDIYRRLHPDATDESYTWWSNRGQAWAKNVGWRLDYQLATPALAERAQSAHTDKTLRLSDHAPLIVDYTPFD